MLIVDHIQITLEVPMTTRIEEIIGSRFAVEMDGLVVASFKECSGLTGEIQVEEYQEGGVNDKMHSHTLQEADRTNTGTKSFARGPHA